MRVSKLKQLNCRAVEPELFKVTAGVMTSESLRAAAVMVKSKWNWRPEYWNDSAFEGLIH